MDQFQDWFAAAQAADPPRWLEVNAMTLSTADRAGYVTSRVVLLKGVQPDGFIFFTNYQSVKGRQMDENPRASLCFFWPHLERQVRVEGLVERVSEAMSDQYFQSRPRESQLGGLLSQQSEPVADRQVLENLFAEFEEKHIGQPVPRPAHWGGYRLQPTRMEFWQGRPSRLHDRILYAWNEAEWVLSRLCP